MEDEWEEYDEGFSDEDSFNAEMEVDGAEINVKITKDRVRVEGEAADSMNEGENENNLKSETNGNLN